MPEKTRRRLLLIGLAALGLSACANNRPWFEGMREGARLQCQRANPNAAQECGEKVDRGTYDEYEKDRQRATVTR